MNGNVSYTRSLSKRSRLSFEYRINYTDNSVERNTFVLTKENVFPDERNPRQSTEYDYAYLTHRIGSTYQYYFKKTKIAGTLHYQHAAFSSDYAFPYRRKTGASFDNLTYNVVSNISISRNNTLKFTAVGRTSNPRATDLQGIVNTTNRQNVFAGNPGLDPVYTHRLSGQYIRANPAKGRTFTVSAEATASPNTITDSLVIDTPDFVIDDEGTLLGEGNQELEIRESDSDDVQLDVNIEGNEDEKSAPSGQEDPLDDLSLDDIDFQSLGSILDDADEGEMEDEDLDEEPTEDDLLASILDTDLEDEDLDDLLPPLEEDDLDFSDDE